MAAELIKGKDVAQKIREDIGKEVEEVKNKTGETPGLAVVILDDQPDSPSHTYVNNKEKAAIKLGFYSEIHRLPESTTQQELMDLVDRLNKDENIHGLLVQLPLPDHIDDEEVTHAISPEKDVDGFHPINIGNLLIGDKCFIPCTPHGCIKMLEYIDYNLEGKNAVVVGRSNIVGKPVSLLLLERNATVTICHSRTKDLGAVCREADVLIVAAGKANMITGDMIKPGAVVIDVGINRVEGKLVGDVEFESAEKVASYITPVPGGVGPMTITMLLLNALHAFKFKHELD